MYTIELPKELPTGFRGWAFKFTYDLVISLNIAWPYGKKQRVKEISVPIRVWANVSCKSGPETREAGLSLDSGASDTSIRCPEAYNPDQGGRQGH